MRGLKCIYITFAIFLVAGLLYFPLASMARGETKLVVGANSDARTLDPVTAADTGTRRVLRHIYDDLFVMNRKMRVTPNLAASHEQVDDRTWIIKLKKGIRFHNGEPFDAESVKFTFDFVLNPANKALTISYIGRVDRVEIIDDYTVKIITKEPFFNLLENLADFFMAPPKLAKEKGMAYLANHPVGTGPWKFESWSKDREICLIKNEQYWRGAPKIDKLVFRIIPEVAPRVSALMVGEVDLIPDVPPHLINQVNNSGIASVKTIAGWRVIYVAFDNVSETVVRDVKVRQALNYAVNVDEIINSVLEGVATQVPGVLVPLNKDYDDSLRPYPYDPEKAKKLLREAGYGPDKPLNLTFNSCQGRYLKDKEAAQAIASYWTKIGVNVKLRFHEWGTYLRMIKGFKAQDCFLFGKPDRVFEGGIIYNGHKAGIAWCPFEHPEIEEALARIMPIMDVKKRAEGMKELQALLHRLAVWVFLWNQHDVWGVSNQLDWEPRADGGYYLYDAKIKR